MALINTYHIWHKDNLTRSPDLVIIGMKSSGLEPSLFSTRTTLH